MYRRLWVSVCLSLVLFQPLAMGQGKSDDVKKIEAKVEEFKRIRAVAETAKEKGDYAAAITAGESMMELARDLLGDDWPVLIEPLKLLAECEEARANWDAAKEHRTDVLNRTIKAYGEADYRVVDARLARDHVSRLIQLTAAERQRLADAQSANREVVKLLQQGQYAAADELAKNVLAEREILLGPDHPDTAVSLNNLASLYKSQGNYAAAEPLYQRALKIGEKALGPDHPYTAHALINLASLYDSQGNYPAAEPLYQRALKILEKALGPDHPRTGTSLNNLALLFNSQGNYAAAEPLYRRALKILEKALGPDHPHTAHALKNLASLYDNQGNYAAAEPLMQRALKIRETALGPDHPDTGTSVHDLGALYYAQGNSAAAEPLFQRALEIKEKSLGPDHPDTAVCLCRLAAFSWDQRQDAVARDWISRSLPIEIAHLERTAAIQSETQQFLMTKSVQNTVSYYLTIMASDPTAAPETWRTLLDWKGLITARQTRLRQALKDDPLYADFQVVTQKLSTQILNPPRPPSDPKSIAAWNEKVPALREAWKAERAKLEAEHERLEKELARQSATFRATVEQLHVSPEDIQRLLAKQAAPTALIDLLEYDYCGRAGEPNGRRIAAFVARGDREVTRLELGPVQPIHALIETWRETFGLGEAGQAAGRQLREKLWQPLEPHLAGIQVVVISPDGKVGELPWGALPGAKPGSYLLEEVALAVIPVPQMLPQLLQVDSAAGPPRSLLLAGDIDYGGDAGAPGDSFASRATRRTRDGKPKQFDRLDAAQAELASIERRYRKQRQDGTSDSLEGSEATEIEFRKQAPQHQWLHVITHGYFAPDAVAAPAPQVAGIGVALQVEEGHLKVTQVVAGGAAAKDGRLIAGDEIVAVTNLDGEWVTMEGKTIEDTAVIRGPVGAEIRLRVRPKDQEGEPVEYTLKRAAISVPVERDATVDPGLLSGLAFAGANTPPAEGEDDGIFTALEVSALDLSHVDAVVLSACETGLGEVAGGEGLLGLQRAFQVAGAKTTVASLWKVPDRATATLMQRFYENLWAKKMGKLAALREAQVWMLREKGNRGLAIPDHPTEGESLPPYYWAAFVLSGDWR